MQNLVFFPHISLTLSLLVIILAIYFLLSFANLHLSSHRKNIFYNVFPLAYLDLNFMIMITDTTGINRFGDKHK